MIQNLVILGFVLAGAAVILLAGLLLSIRAAHAEMSERLERLAIETTRAQQAIVGVTIRLDAIVHASKR